MKMLKHTTVTTFSLYILLVSFFPQIISAQDAVLEKYRWTLLDAKGNPTPRHENVFVAFEGKFYLLAGRGINPVDVFDPISNTWEKKSSSPMEIHHFQPVVYKDAIYIVGAMTGRYPKETPLTHVWKYFPKEDRWEKGHVIPEARRRGGAGAVVYNDKIYIACGIDFGHTSGTNNNFDEYNPETGEWTTLVKAPHIRDHFPAIVLEDKLYCVGGRNTSFHTKGKFSAFFGATTPWVDVYDFKKKTWETLEYQLPVPTAAGGLFSLSGKIIYTGGEGFLASAYNNTQCLDLKTGQWSQLSPLFVGRHGSSAVVHNNDVYFAAGSPNRGGGNMNTIEVFSKNHDWVSLFNGDNLNGWSVKCEKSDSNKEYWKVQDGAIVCDTEGNSDQNYMWLQSDNEYANFELRLKFQAFENYLGNSGVQVRSRYDAKAKVDKSVKGWMDGPQIDIDPKTKWRTGLIYDETRTEKRWIHPSLENWTIGNAHKPKKSVFYCEDEFPYWNDVIIICNGTKITTYINNVKVSEYDGNGVIDNKGHRKLNVGLKGHIALQLHKNHATKIRFKDIEIREL